MNDPKMITKNVSVDHVHKNPHKYIKFYAHIVELKNLYRQGWVRRWELPEEKAESVAEHIFSLAMMLLLYAKEQDLKIDIYRTILMALVHDIVEAIAGDVIPTDDMPREEKIRRERTAIYEIFDGFESKGFFISLWEEYVAQETEEAVYAHDFDKLDAVLMAFVYHENGLHPDAKTHFIKGALKKVKTREVREIILSLKD